MEPTTYIWLDGKMVPWEDATVHVLTHALHYGTGVIEGIRAYDTGSGTAVFRLTDHMERLQRSAKAYHISLEWSVEDLAKASKELLAANELEAGYVRPLVFLELGAVGLNPANARVRTTIITWRWGAYLGEEGIRNGIRTKVSSWRRFSGEAFPNAKATGTYINSILAKMEAVRAGYDEAIMLNGHGDVSEGSGENVFIVKDGKVLSPPISAGCLDGITRHTVVTLLREDGIEVTERPVHRSDLYYCDEMFLTGTAAEVTPVREVDDRPVGDGKPGEVTLRAQELFRDAVTGKLGTHPEWLEFV
jgi:branched-chain amino acid aminotransferase